MLNLVVAVDNVHGEAAHCTITLHHKLISFYQQKKPTAKAVEHIIICVFDIVLLYTFVCKIVSTCTCRVMSFLSVAFIAHISPVLVQSVLEHVHC